MINHYILHCNCSCYHCRCAQGTRSLQDGSDARCSCQPGQYEVVVIGLDWIGLDWIGLDYPCADDPVPIFVLQEAIFILQLVEVPAVLGANRNVVTQHLRVPL